MQIKCLNKHCYIHFRRAVSVAVHRMGWGGVRGGGGKGMTQRPIGHCSLITGAVQVAVLLAMTSFKLKNGKSERFNCHDVTLNFIIRAHKKSRMPQMLFINHEQSYL